MSRLTLLHICIASLVLLLSACTTGENQSSNTSSNTEDKTSEKTEGYADVSLSDLQSAIDKGSVTVIDVNGSESYAKAHIPGAHSYSAIQDKLAEHLPKEKDALIVAYCGGPQCTAYKKAADAAVELGYTNVAHLSAGLSGWKEAGKKTDSVQQ